MQWEHFSEKGERKTRKLDKWISELEQKTTKLDKEMHPTAEGLKDALWDAIQFCQKNRTFARDDNAQSRRGQ